MFGLAYFASFGFQKDPWNIPFVWNPYPKQTLKSVIMWPWKLPCLQPVSRRLTHSSYWSLSDPDMFLFNYRRWSSSPGTMVRFPSYFPANRNSNNCGHPFSSAFEHGFPRGVVGVGLEHWGMAFKMTGSNSGGQCFSNSVYICGNEKNQYISTGKEYGFCLSSHGFDFFSKLFILRWVYS